MQARYFHILYIVSILIVFQCCQKESPVSLDPSPCVNGINDFTVAASEQPDSSILACQNCPTDCQEKYSALIPYDYYYPCFNPNNANQLAYYRYTNTVWSPSFEIWVQDFCSGEKTLLSSQALHGIDWSVKDWLIFTASDQNIWKIKSTGDSLTQLTFDGAYNRSATWRPDGAVFCHNTQTTGGESHFILRTAAGELLDTIPKLKHASHWSWIDEGQLCYAVGDADPTILAKMHIYNFQTQTTSFLHDFPANHPSKLLPKKTIYLAKENAILWSAQGAVGKTNLQTGQFEIIREKLFHERFEALSLSPAENKIVFNKLASYYIGNCHYDSEIALFQMTTDGKQLQRLELAD